MMEILRRVRRPEVIIALLALAASGPSLTNGFVYDDVPIVLNNPVVHDVEQVGRIWRSGYWPAGLLYRPVTIQIFALQWAAGGGRPIVFHAVNILLALATTLALWRLARRLVPPLAAAAAAALFAVHPVHVEVVGNVVGQSELLAALFAILAVERYLAWRDEGALTLRRRVGLAALTLLAVFSKETGYVIPLLLAAAELAVVRRRTERPWRAGGVVPAFQLQFAAIVAAILVRIAVLGPTPGAGPAVAMETLAPADRIVGMLAVVPEWLRLLFWPAHLQAEYGPPALTVTGTLGPAHLLGIAILVGAGVLVVAAWRRAPVIAFGVAWAAIALLPVSNILTTTGVILAERTLFLPSAGALLALAAAAAILLDHLTFAPARGAMLAGGLALIAVGAVRSAERQRTWSSQLGFFQQLERDGPRTYRAQLGALSYYSGAGRYSEAERAGRRSLALYQADPRPYEELGQVLRIGRRCAEAVPILAEGVRRFPDRTLVRSRLIECLLAVKDTARALALAEEAVRLEQPEFGATVRRLQTRQALP